MRAAEDIPAKEGKRNPAPLQLQLFPSLVASSPAAPRVKLEASSVEPSRSPREPRPESPPASADFDRAAFLRRLGKLMPGRLGAVTLTDNRSTIVSAREVGGRLDIRIQRCFAQAPDDTLTEIAAFLTSGKRSRARGRALAAIRAYFERQCPSPSRVKRRRLVLRPVGRALDLREIRDRINRQYFGDELDVHITWGRAPSRRRRGRRSFSVRLGTYGDHDQVVRIHRCLDRVDVPRYVVESVVYHEMLHAAVPPVVENGRRRIHTPEFRRRERLFPSYQRAERWLDRNLKRLT